MASNIWIVAASQEADRRAAQEVEDIEQDEITNTYSAAQAADFLGLEVIEFSQYEVKSRICYQLIKGRRMYHEKELLRFRREVLDHV